MPPATTHPTAVAEDDRPRPRLSGRRLAVGVLLTASVVAVALLIGNREQARETPVDRTEATYVVRPGDTIASVADLHALSAEELMAVNDLTLSDSLEPGSRLEIPINEGETRDLPAELLDDPAKLSYASAFERAAAEHDLPPGLLEAVAWQGSEWVNAYVDVNGRVGLGQLRPEIVDWLGRDVVESTLDPTVAEENVALTAAYFAHLLELSEGDLAASLAAYHLGLHEPADGVWDLETVAFVRTVLDSVPDFAGPDRAMVPEATGG